MPESANSELLRGFTEALVRLLNRWGLVSLASWDLPTPQGPLLPDYLPSCAPARPTHGVYLYVPVHYPLQGDDGLQQQVAEFQRQQAAELSIDPSFAGNSHHETYEQMFRVMHLEKAIRRRFSHPVRGLVVGIEETIAEVLHRSAERVGRLRKMIAKCLAGKRALVKELRIKA